MSVEQEFHVVGEWLVVDVGHHTCGTGPDGHYGAHEPWCGLEPVARVSEVLDALRLRVTTDSDTGCTCEMSPPEFGGNLPDRECPLHGEARALRLAADLEALAASWEQEAEAMEPRRGLPSATALARRATLERCAHALRQEVITSSTSRTRAARK